MHLTNRLLIEAQIETEMDQFGGSIDDFSVLIKICHVGQRYYMVCHYKGPATVTLFLYI